MRWLVVVLVMVTACKKAEQKPVDPALELTAEEISQGREACAAYVKRVCACPALTSECEDARSMPSGFEMVLDVLEGKGESPKDGKPDPSAKPVKLSKTEKREIVGAARKVVAACVAADSKLDPKVCPR